MDVVVGPLQLTLSDELKNLFQLDCVSVSSLGWLPRLNRSPSAFEIITALLSHENTLTHQKSPEHCPHPDQCCFCGLICDYESPSIACESCEHWVHFDCGGVDPACDLEAATFVCECCSGSVSQLSDTSDPSEIPTTTRLFAIDARILNDVLFNGPFHCRQVASTCQWNAPEMPVTFSTSSPPVPVCSIDSKRSTSFAIHLLQLLERELEHLVDVEHLHTSDHSHTGNSLAIVKDSSTCGHLRFFTINPSEIVHLKVTQRDGQLLLCSIVSASHLLRFLLNLSWRLNRSNLCDPVLRDPLFHRFVLVLIKLVRFLIFVLPDGILFFLALELSTPTALGLGKSHRDCF